MILLTLILAALITAYCFVARRFYSGTLEATLKDPLVITGIMRNDFTYDDVRRITAKTAILWPCLLPEVIRRLKTERKESD